MREFSVVQGAATLAGGSTTSLIAVGASTAASVNIEFLRFWVGQYANATSAQQRVFIKISQSSFATVTSYTPNKLKTQDANASYFTGGTYTSLGIIGVNASAEGGGTPTNVHEDAFNVLNGWLYVPTPPETRIMNSGVPAATVGSQTSIALTTVTTNSNWAWGMNYREV